jgi:2-oxoglutarate ferredoxin oxidoreductase subunit gamma
MREGQYVTYIPSYGAEVRGGTAHCAVIISPREIASPIVSSPSLLIVMNEPSLVKFEPRIKSGGLFILNSTLVLSEPRREDVEAICIPATQMADELGTVQCANMIVLGCLIARTQLVRVDTVVEGLKKALPERKRHLLEVNIRALERGRVFFESLEHRQSAALD